VLIRVDNGYAKWLKEKKTIYSRQLGKPVTLVQVTRILNEPNKSVVFYKKRGKQVQL